LTHQVARTFEISLLRVRGADDGVKPGAWAPGSRQEKRSKPAKRAAVESFGQAHRYHPLRGFNRHLGTWPGAHAPGFMLTSAPRTHNKVMRQVC